jgi:hypothetical protein
MENTEKIFWARISAMLILSEICINVILYNHNGIWTILRAAFILLNGTLMLLMYQKLKKVHNVQDDPAYETVKKD